MLLTAFQPIRELSAGNVAGFEALARFVSRDGASADTWLRETAAAGLGEDLEIAALHCALSAALLESGDVAMDRIVIELVGLVRRRRAGRTDTGLGTAAPAGPARCR